MLTTWPIVVMKSNKKHLKGTLQRCRATTVATLINDPDRLGFRNDWSHFGKLLLGSCSLNLLHWWVFGLRSTLKKVLGCWMGLLLSENFSLWRAVPCLNCNFLLSEGCLCQGLCFYYMATITTLRIQNILSQRWTHQIVAAFLKNY